MRQSRKYELREGKERVLGALPLQELSCKKRKTCELHGQLHRINIAD